MKKLISIGLVLALLVTLLPVAVGAQVPCELPPPCKVPVPKYPSTESLGGALLWTVLGATYIMGKAVGDLTGHTAATLGYFVDELAPPVFGVIAGMARGIAGVLEGVGGLVAMLKPILDPIATMLKDLATLIQDLLD